MTASKTENPDWGFGDMVTATITRAGDEYEVEGEVIATGPDNRDLRDDEYIIALGMDAHVNEALDPEELIRQDDVTDWNEP
jgi:hypothetical protein